MLVYFEVNGGKPKQEEVFNRGIAVKKARAMSKVRGTVRLSYNREMIGAIAFENGVHAEPATA